MTPSPQPRVLPDAEALAAAAAAAVVALAKDALAARQAFRVGLPGGRSVTGLLAALASPPHADELDWPRVDVLFADERAVAPGDSQSNYRFVLETLLEPLGARAPRVTRMPADAEDLEAAAREYESALELPLDLLVLGVGEDGHVASLFPGSPLVQERARRVAAVYDSPKPPARRLTVTPRVLAEARAVMVLAVGAGKSGAVAAALDPEAIPIRVPAALARGAAWWLDRDAASKLPGASAGRGG